MAENNVYPRIPESNWWAIRAQLRKSMPPDVSVSYLKSLLSLTSDKSAKNLIPPLRQMKLIGEDGKPTDRANEWRDDDKYAAVCEKIVEEIYPPELRSLYPGPDFDKDRIAQWFMTTAKLGEGAAKLAASMYILLSSKELKTDQNTSNGNPNKGTKKVVEKKSPSRLKSNSSTTMQSNDSAPNTVSVTPSANVSAPTPTLHIDLQIHISPDASNEQIENIFASIAKHLYKANQ